MEGRNRKLNRWPGYDYSQSGFYFVTICTHKRIEWFGRVANGEMILNQYGTIANNIWREIPNHYPDIIIDIHQIMPNHVHGIIEIRRPRRDKACLVPTGAACLVPTNANTITDADEQINRMHQLLFNVIGSYKSAVSKSIHECGLPEFAWQRSFHDRVIRNNDELNRIRAYIARNPLQWESDIHNN